MRGYYTLNTENLDKEHTLWLSDGDEQITVYIEPMRNTYMGRPQVEVWYKDRAIMLCDEATLRDAGLQRISYMEAKGAA